MSSRSRGRKVKKTPKAAVPLDLQRHRRKHIVWSIAFSVALTMLLIFIKDLFEKTQPGAYLEDIARDWLQYNLAAHKDLADPKIVVVDISSLSRHPGTGYTDRDQLRNVVEAVASHKPRAIGIDVYFSPEDNQPSFAPDEDRKFFNYCLEKRKTTNEGLLFLGISSTDIVKSPDKCLGSSEFCSLAAYVDYPNAETLVTTEMDEYIEVLHTSDEGEIKYWRYPSLAAAIAHQPLSEPSGLAKWALEPSHLVKEAVGDPFNIQHTRFVVNFSRIDDFDNGKVLASADPDGLAALRGDQHLSGKDITVLIGRGMGTADSDRFSVPGHGKRYPGVFLHASAAYTLIQDSHRLRLMTHPAAWSLDAAVSFLIFAPIVFIQFYYHRRTRQEVATHRLNLLFTWSMIAFLFLGGVWMVNRTRVFWEDFPLVMIGLLVHSRLEQGAEAAPGVFKKWGSWWRLLALKSEDRARE